MPGEELRDSSALTWSIQIPEQSGFGTLDPVLCSERSLAPNTQLIIVSSWVLRLRRKNLETRLGSCYNKS